MKKESGFTYPISICLLMFFCTFLLIHTQLFRTETLLSAETERIYIQEYYLLSSVRKAEQLLSQGKLPVMGEFLYREGSVEYKVQAVSAATDSVSFTLKMNAGEETQAVSHYDKTKKMMVKWYEKH
ncbi:competence type IV pilus minor pilin ComGG [Mesobacillus zeae]|uniref:Competence protein ComG n=1 Tax=Mesobacillus zeae TaxID=1917180 RepID=A0A398B1Z1_9BACI|nr:competence type IV pilus minor pilin ComGG [Mesobacillus zeae]RID83867.1 hypothetical protein D1970_14805 [Mesobacillus zeae]